MTESDTRQTKSGRQRVTQIDTEWETESDTRQTQSGTVAQIGTELHRGTDNGTVAQTDKSIICNWLLQVAPKSAVPMQQQFVHHQYMPLSHPVIVKKEVAHPTAAVKESKTPTRLATAVTLSQVVLVLVLVPLLSHSLGCAC